MGFGRVCSSNPKLPRPVLSCSLASWGAAIARRPSRPVSPRLGAFHPAPRTLPSRLGRPLMFFFMKFLFFFVVAFIVFVLIRERAQRLVPIGSPTPAPESTQIEGQFGPPNLDTHLIEGLAFDWCSSKGRATRPWVAFWEVKNFRTPAAPGTSRRPPSAASPQPGLRKFFTSINRKETQEFCLGFSQPPVPDRHGEDPFSM